MDFLPTSSYIISPYHEFLRMAHNPGQSHLSISFCAVRSVPTSEWETSVVLGILFLLKKLFRTHLVTPRLSVAQGDVSDCVAGFCHDFVQSWPIQKGKGGTKAKSPTLKSGLSCCHGGFPAELALGSPSHLQGFCLWSALVKSTEALLGEKNINCLLYVSEEDLCWLDSRIFLTEDGTAEIFQRGNLDHDVQHYSPSPSVSRIYGKIMTSTIAITTVSPTQSLNIVFLEELKAFHST